MTQKNFFSFYFFVFFISSYLRRHCSSHCRSYLRLLRNVFITRYVLALCQSNSTIEHRYYFQINYSSIETQNLNFKIRWSIVFINIIQVLLFENKQWHLSKELSLSLFAELLCIKNNFGKRNPVIGIMAWMRQFILFLAQQYQIFD